MFPSDNEGRYFYSVGLAKVFELMYSPSTRKTPVNFLHKAWTISTKGFLESHEAKAFHLVPEAVFVERPLLDRDFINLDCIFVNVCPVVFDLVGCVVLVKVKGYGVIELDIAIAICLAACISNFLLNLPRVAARATPEPS